MEKRGVCFARKLILAAWVFFLLLILPAVNAEAKEVSLVKGDSIKYMGYSTHYYYVDGNLAFCLEPDMKSPGNGVYSASELESGSYLGKAMYYMYGGPGYEQYIKDSLTGGWGADGPAYCLTHCVLSYIYDGCDQNSPAFKGLNADIASAVVMYADYVKNLPDIPDAELAFSENGLTAYYDRNQKCQRTQSVQLVGDTANGITIPLPEGVTLVNETKGTTGTGNVKVSGGDTFYLRADVAYGNGTTWSSGEIRGEIAKAWKVLLVKTGTGSQDIGTASMQQSESSPVALQVKWLDKPELQVEKHADKSGKTYKLGDIITYTLDVTQQIEKAVAKNVVITDTILTEGVKLQKNSVVLLNENGEKIPDAKITVQGNSYTIHACEFLEGPESGQKYTVEYQVAITDESIIGKEIENEVVVRSENAEEVKDRETVKVEEEPEPEPEPEEPEPEEPAPEEPTPENPVPEEPASENPSEEPKTPVEPVITKSVPLKASTVKTGDVANITGMALLLILSCTVIVLCGTMDAWRKAKKHHKKH